MLKTPRLRSNPLLNALAGVIGGGVQTRIMSEGMVQIGHFSSDILLYGRNGAWDVFDFNGAPTYGVCDSPEQFKEKFGEALEKDARNLAVFFTHIPKVIGEKHGWRWHKWGEYVGSGEPTTEYLADEDGFQDGVYVFNVHDIDWRPKLANR